MHDGGGQLKRYESGLTQNQHLQEKKKSSVGSNIFEAKTDKNQNDVLTKSDQLQKQPVLTSVMNEILDDELSPTQKTKNPRNENL